MSAASATELSAPEQLDPRFAAIYREHVDYVWSNLRRLGVPIAELDDAVQETFLVAFRRREAFVEGGSWRSWLFGIARRVAAHQRRSSGRRLRLVAAATREPNTHPDPYDDVALRDAARLVHRFLQNISPRQREVFILAELEGHTGAEIADALEINANTVWSRLHAARGSFDRYLETLRARERGADQRWDRASLLRDAQDERAPALARRRMMAALGAQLSLPATGASSAPWILLAKPVALALGLSMVTLGAIAGGARVLRSSDDVRAAAAPVAPAAVAPPSASERAPAPKPPPAATPTSSPPPPPAAVLEPPATPARRPAPAPPRDTANASVATITAELGLLQRVREAAQAGNHARVLELAAVHVRDFPQGELAVERDVQRIAAMCGLGRHSEAKANITTFAARHPSARLPTRVLAACSDGEKKPTKSGRPGQEQ